MAAFIACGLPIRVLERAYMSALLSRSGSSSDEFGQAQVGEDEVELGDVGDVETVAGGEPVAQLETALGGAVHGVPVLIAHRRHRAPRRTVDEGADPAEAVHLLEL